MEFRGSLGQISEAKGENTLTAAHSAQCPLHETVFCRSCTYHYYHVHTQ